VVCFPAIQAPDGESRSRGFSCPLAHALTFAALPAPVKAARPVARNEKTRRKGRAFVTYTIVKQW